MVDHADESEAGMTFSLESTGEPAFAQTLDGLRVLIVEDTDDSRIMLKSLLEMSGATVTAAATAEEAFEFFTAERPDVLVSDIGLPREDGLSLIRKIRKLPPEQGAQVPAVATTAFTSEEDRKATLEAGYQAHVCKPLDVGELITIIRSITATC